MKDVFKGYLYVILATVIWGTSSLWLRNVSTNVYQTTFIRVILGTIILAIFLNKKIQIKKIKKDIPWFVVSALGIMLSFVFYFKAVNTTTVSNAILAFYTTTIFTALLAPVLIKEKIDKYTIIALPIGFLGVYLILPEALTFHNHHVIGILFALLAAISNSLFALYSRQLTKKYNFIEILFYQLAISSVLLLPFIFKPWIINIETIISLIVIILAVTLGAYLLFIKALSYITAQHGEILSNLEVFFQVILAVIFLNEMIASKTIFGGIFIIAAGIIVVMSKK